MYISPLTKEQLHELAAFLHHFSEKTMSISMLDGYLTAIAVGPDNINPSLWLPSIWGNDGEVRSFKSVAENKHILEYIITHFNSIMALLKSSNGGIEPIYNVDEDGIHHDARQWSIGFYRGWVLGGRVWQVLFDSEDRGITLGPIVALSNDQLSAEDNMRIATAEQRHGIACDIPEGVKFIYQFWLRYHQANAERDVAKTMMLQNPKVRRNDLCPCGSGKKFKKCCGVAVNLH